MAQSKKPKPIVVKCGACGWRPVDAVKFVGMAQAGNLVQCKCGAFVPWEEGR